MDRIYVLLWTSHARAKSQILNTALNVFAHTYIWVLDVFDALGHRLLVCSLHLA